MFVIGALPALLVFYLRRYVTEPEISAASRAKQAAEGNRPALWEIFSGPILKTTILASLMATGCQGGYYAVTFWVPRFLTAERNLSIVDSTGYLSALIIGSFIGYLVGAWLADRIGRRNLFLTFSLGAIAVVLVYTQVPIDQRAAVGARLPARLLRLRLFLRRRRIPHGTLSDEAARIGPGLLLQFRPRHRRAVSVPGRRALDDDDACATRSRSSPSRLTACSSSPPSRCRRRAARCCMRIRE